MAGLYSGMQNGSVYSGDPMFPGYVAGEYCIYFIRRCDKRRGFCCLCAFQACNRHGGCQIVCSDRAVPGISDDLSGNDYVFGFLCLVWSGHGAEEEKSMKDEIAFGPFIAAGTFITLLIGA